MDHDRSEERPKPIQDRHIIKLQQNCHDPNGEERKKQHLVYAFEFGRGQVARLREVDDGERDLASDGHSATPTPNGFGWRLDRQQENSEDGIGEGQN